MQLSKSCSNFKYKKTQNRIYQDTFRYKQEKKNSDEDSCSICLELLDLSAVLNKNRKFLSPQLTNLNFDPIFLDNFLQCH